MKRVLVIDDSAAILRVLKFGIERAGYAVTTACDGSNALEKLCERQPDFMVTDVEMPRMTGEELCLEIEKKFPDRTFPIVVLTSSTDLSHRRWAQELRDTIFMEKPVSINRLVSHMDSCLGGA